jgi:hypothetical protein
MTQNLKNSPVDGPLRALGRSEGLGWRTLSPPGTKASPTCVDRRFQFDGHPFILVEQSRLLIAALSRWLAISHFGPQ